VNDYLGAFNVAALKNKGQIEDECPKDQYDDQFFVQLHAKLRNDEPEVVEENLDEVKQPVEQEDAEILTEKI